MCIEKFVFLTIGGKERRIDACIAEIIRALNDGGVATIASCCGHFNRWGSIILKDGRELIISPDFESSRAFDKIHGRPIHDERRALEIKVATPLAGADGINPSKLSDNGPAHQIAVLPLAGTPSDNTSQPESVWPACDNSLCPHWKHGKFNCTLDKCKW